MLPSPRRQIVLVSALLALHVAAGIAVLGLGDHWLTRDGQLHITVALITAQVGIAAAFGALSTAPWFLRWPAVAVVVALLALAFGRGSSPMTRDCGALLTIQALCVLMPLWSLREAGLRLVVPGLNFQVVPRPRWQFSIGFALAWMIAVAVLLLAAKMLHGSYVKEAEPDSLYQDILLLGMGIIVMGAVLALVCVGFALGRGRAAWPGLVVAIVVPAAGLIPLPFAPDMDIAWMMAIAMGVGNILLVTFLVMRIAGYRIAWVR